MDTTRGSLLRAPYAVGAFNVNNLEDAQAVSRAAEGAQMAVIFLVSKSAMEYAGAKNLAAICRSVRESSSVPCFIQLDHGATFEQAVQCICLGFDCIMIDGSRLSFQENVDLTRKVVEVGHAAGVWVEGELGVVGGHKERDAGVAGRDRLTSPSDAEEFAKAAGVDSLAVAIGNAHGLYKEPPALDFERLAAIRERVDAGVEIVLHGASDLPAEQIKRAVSLGVRKVNFGTDLRQGFVRGMEKALPEAKKKTDHRVALKAARDEVEAVVKEKLSLLRLGS